MAVGPPTSWIYPLKCGFWVNAFASASTLSRLRQVYPNALVVAGKTYDGEDTTITLTMEQLEQMESDPAEVFKSFCREEMGQEATDHFLQLFAQAVEEADAE